MLSGNFSGIFFCIVNYLKLFNCSDSLVSVNFYLLIHIITQTTPKCYIKIRGHHIPHPSMPIFKKKNKEKTSNLIQSSTFSPEFFRMKHQKLLLNAITTQLLICCVIILQFIRTNDSFHIFFSSHGNIHHLQIICSRHQKIQELLISYH